MGETIQFLRRYCEDKPAGEIASVVAEMVESAIVHDGADVDRQDQAWVWDLCTSHGRAGQEVRERCSAHRSALTVECLERAADDDSEIPWREARRFAAALDDSEVERLLDLPSTIADRLDAIPGFARRILLALESPATRERLESQLPADCVLIPSGDFAMGGPPKPDQMPASRVWLPSFVVRVFPLTIGEARSMDLSDEGGRPELPAGGLSLFRISERLRGQRWRLLSEPEWEKAARGPSEFRFPWGNVFETNRANTLELGLGERTPVDFFGALGASGYGVRDMVGNLWEWTSTQYARYGGATQAPSDFRPSDSTLDRVLRGGAYDWDEAGANCLNRYRCSPDRAWDTHGARFALAL